MAQHRAVVSCLVCKLGLLETSKRRKLYGPSSHLVLDQLRDVATQLGYEAMVPAPSPAVPQVSDEPYLCRTCFSQLEKRAKLQAQLAELDRDVKEKLQESASSLGLQPSTSQLSLTPSRRRPLPFEDRPAAKRPRQAPSTPVRQVIRQTVAERSPAVTVVVKRQKRSSNHHLTSSLKKLGKSVGRRNPSAIARQVMSHRKTKEAVLRETGLILRKELQTLCKSSAPSMLRGTSPQALKTFQWDSLVDELEERSPTLLEVLRACVSRRRRKSRKGRSYAASENTVIGLCAAILLRHRNIKMNLVQRVLSLLLYSEHTPKQLYKRLQKLLLCLSHPRTLATVDKLGKDHDAPVREWSERVNQIYNRRELATARESAASEPSVRGLVPGPDSLSDSDLEFLSARSGPVEVEPTPDEYPDQPGPDTVESTSDLLVLPSSPSSPVDVDPISPEAPPYSPLSGLESSSSSGTESSQEEVSQSESTESSQSSSTEFRGEVEEPVYPTYKLVGDNVDKHVKPREMRVDAQAETLHYFNTYAVRDRVDASTLPDKPALPDRSSIEVEDILPSPQDHTAITTNFAILIGRVLRKYMPYLTNFGFGLEKHIKHKFYEMSHKSEVVPLEILPKSETKHEDMISILDTLHQYVPTTSTIQSIESIEVSVDHFHYTLFGGDMLTTARARGSKKIRSNSERGKDRLEGLLPVTEDWHAKVCLLSAIWKRLYSCSSGRDAGSLYQLRTLINRRNVVKKPKNSVTACEEFFLLVVEAHILSAAMEVFGMSSLEDSPSADSFPEGSSTRNPKERRKILLLAVHKILDKFVELSFPAPTSKPDSDHVRGYARDVLTMGLLFMEFTDAIREGDGIRILRCWRYFLPIFKGTKRTNYSIEAFTMLAQYQFIYTPRMQQQLLWSRTVNTRGRPGRNIPADLHMEHINRECKKAIQTLGPNVTRESSIARVGKNIGELMKVAAQYDRVHGIRQESGRRSRRSVAADLQKLLKQLHEDTRVFKSVRGRQHAHFRKYKNNFTRTLKKPKLVEWMNEQLEKLLMQ